MRTLSYTRVTVMYLEAFVPWSPAPGHKHRLQQSFQLQWVLWLPLYYTTCPLHLGSPLLRSPSLSLDIKNHHGIKKKKPAEVFIKRKKKIRIFLISHHCCLPLVFCLFAFFSLLGQHGVSIPSASFTKKTKHELFGTHVPDTLPAFCPKPILSKIA